MPIDPAEKTLQHMRSLYGPFLDRTPMLPLDASNVPEGLAGYIPYAALWGIADDLQREQLVSQAPEEARADLIRVIQAVDDQLDDWLGGEEAASPAPSPEYVAFSAMRMAADFM